MSLFAFVDWLKYKKFTCVWEVFNKIPSWHVSFNNISVKSFQVIFIIISPCLQHSKWINTTTVPRYPSSGTGTANYKVIWYIWIILYLNSTDPCLMGTFNGRISLCFKYSFVRKLINRSIWISISYIFMDWMFYWMSEFWLYEVVWFACR